MLVLDVLNIIAGRRGRKGGAPPPFLVESWHTEVSKIVWHLKIGPLVQKLDMFEKKIIW